MFRSPVFFLHVTGSPLLPWWWILSTMTPRMVAPVVSTITVA